MTTTAVQYPLWVAGRWQEGEEPLAPRSPYDGKVVGGTTLAGPELVEEAISSATAAKEAMADLSAMDRFQALDYVRRRMRVTCLPPASFRRARGR